MANMAKAPAAITNVLGEVRPVVMVFEDGSYGCPFCGYPAFETCWNPVCTANPSMSADGARALVAARDRERAAQVERDRIAATRARMAEGARTFRHQDGGQ